MVEEMSAGRQLMLGVQMYADDNGGAVFPGYASDPGAVDNHGQPLSFPTNARIRGASSHICQVRCR